MSTSNRLGVRVKPNDEELLNKLANLLDRNLSDTVRFAIKYTARDFGLLPRNKTPAAKQRLKRLGIQLEGIQKGNSLSLNSLFER